MRTSDQARARLVTEMRSNERPISERYRLAGEHWARLNKAAQMFEEAKSAVLSQMMNKHADKPVSKAEVLVKSSKEWSDYLTRMVEAREAANIARVEMKALEIEFSEWQSSDANARRERQMGRAGP